MARNIKVILFPGQEEGREDVCSYPTWQTNNE